ncbi:MAG TPA: YggS family pyridoxal phosphate-dependent enzyme [Gammaproteobacteria bacterium]|nr:YggS family pyridoxal phosphate-dependent enzyme [Gammaproteobacteria bacterium]|tara:strand:- start:261 stop:938 length:678 start_codon:yes stop_codon:yes gene_type:complete
MVLEISSYHKLETRLAETALRHGRSAGDIDLLAVSKRQSIEAIKRVAGYGQRKFGENYLQEAESKIAALATFKLEWHFIGKLQSNKTRGVATLFDWVHSVDRLKIAQRLNDQRPETAAPLNICVEVNIDSESSKGGVTIDEVPKFVDNLAVFPKLRIRGLMAMPAQQTCFEQQRKSFRRLREIFVKIDCPAFDTLSMGTSNDFEAAVSEGATIVRIGTALFGSRN